MKTLVLIALAVFSVSALSFAEDTTTSAETNHEKTITNNHGMNHKAKSHKKMKKTVKDNGATTTETKTTTETPATH